MDNEIRQLIEQIHDADGKLVLATTGAGTQAVAWLMGVAGASRTVLECTVPYSKQAFEDWLDQPVEKFVDQKTALRLAGRMQARAQLLSAEDERLVGVACSAAIATDRPKKGNHHAYIATWTIDQVRVWHIQLTKNARTRAEEEAVVSKLILNAIATNYGLEEQLDLNLLPTDAVDMTEFNIRHAAHALYAESIPYFGVYDFGRVGSKTISPEIVFPGSFNPLHKGHLALYHAASEHLGKPLVFEISIRNVDKPTLDQTVALQRAAQFAGRYPVYLTNAPTFLEKARIFNGCKFVIGYDTAARILNPRYANNSVDEMNASLREMRVLGCEFLVAGRAEGEQFLTVADLAVDEAFRPMFIPLPDFRFDISSTELRRNGSAGSR